MTEIADLVQNYLESERPKAKKSKKEKKFYVSDMGKCLRTRFLKRKGVKTEFASHVYWIFKIGDLYHDFVYDALEAQGVLLESEDYVENDHFIGRYDGIVKDSEGLAVLDIKSASKYAFKRVLTGQPNKEAIRQVLTYQMMLKDEGKKDIKKSMLLHINKEPGDDVPVCFLEKHFYLTKKTEGEIREEMQGLVDSWEKNKVPKCTCPSWMKNYNSFLPLCEMNPKKIEGTVMKAIEADKEIIVSKKELKIK